MQRNKLVYRFVLTLSGLYSLTEYGDIIQADDNINDNGIINARAWMKYGGGTRGM